MNEDWGLKFETAHHSTDGSQFITVVTSTSRCRKVTHVLQVLPRIFITGFYTHYWTGRI
jgi:hypothetical protein